MTAKEYLNQARGINREIRSLKAGIERLRETAADVRSPGFKQNYNPNRSAEAPYEKIVERICEMEEMEREAMERLVRLKEQMWGAIGAVPDADQRTVLRSRYLDGRSWAAISCLMGVSERTVYRIHGEALRNFRVPE